MIGLISDTHGLLREEAVRALADSELIIHAGDVGKADVLERLKELAPVVAVRGNIDQDETLPMTAMVRAGAATIFVLHDVKTLGPVPEGIDIVVSGHSHKPDHSERHGVLFLNPGAAGPRRFKLPISVARLDVSGKPWKVEFVTL